MVVLDGLPVGGAAGGDAGLGRIGDEAPVEHTIVEHGVTVIAHFVAKIVVPDSVSDPLGYYHSNTVKTRALLESAVRGDVRHVIFTSMAAVSGELLVSPVPEEIALNPINPYGRSKLMSEWMLADAAIAYGMSMWRCAISTSPVPIRKGAPVSLRPMPPI